MKFKSLDLNLLVALDILLDEKNVTRAAERMNVSQPAMSAALARLREHFNEPLLVLHGKRMVPTPAALQMREPLKDLLKGVETLVTGTTRFEPEKSERRFRIVTSDYLLAVIFPALTQKFEQIAPKVTMDCSHPSDQTPQLLDQGDIDLVITPQEHISSGHPAELLFSEKYVVVGCAKNPLFKKGKITEKDFFNARHVVVEIGQITRTSVAENHLRNLNAGRRIDMTVSSFLTAPEMLVNTMKITVMHERLARIFCQRLDLATAELPFKFPLMQEMIQFHETRKHDAGLRWLINQIKSLA